MPSPPPRNRRKRRKLPLLHRLQPPLLSQLFHQDALHEYPRKPGPKQTKGATFLAGQVSRRARSAFTLQLTTNAVVTAECTGISSRRTYGRGAVGRPCRPNRNSRRKRRTAARTGAAKGHRSAVTQLPRVCGVGRPSLLASCVLGVADKIVKDLTSPPSPPPHPSVTEACRPTTSSKRGALGQPGRQQPAGAGRPRPSADT